MENFGEKIFALRKSKGISQEELSELIGVSRQTIYKWETNAVQPTHSNVELLCNVFEVNESYFYNINTQTEPDNSEITVKTKTDKGRKKTICIIAIIVFSICLLISGLTTFYIGITVFTSNTGDKVWNTRDFDTGQFYLTLTITIICFLVIISTSIVMVVMKKKRKM